MWKMRLGVATCLLIVTASCPAQARSAVQRDVEGYAIASVDYRLSTEARFPAQVHDIKAAIRFLRARGGEWSLPTEKIVVAGDSAGGHLAALVGVTNGHAELEGTVGTHQQAGSAAQGIMQPTSAGSSILCSAVARSMAPLP